MPGGSTLEVFNLWGRFTCNGRRVPWRSRTILRHTSRGRCSGWEARSSHRHSLPPPSRPREFHPEPLTGRVGDWRAGLGRSLYSLLPRPFGCEVSQHLDHAHVSSPRHVERSVWISLTTLTCLLHAKVYETYLAGATFGCGHRTL